MGDVTVVGGGALGLASALALAEAGHRVVLRERAHLGSGATAKAAGILSSFAWNDADYRLIAETRGALGETIALALAAGERNARTAWRSAPSLVVGGPGESHLLDSLQDRVERHTEECERMDHRQAGAEFPSLHFDPGEEVLVAQEDGVIEAGDFVAALRARLDQEGVQVVEGASGTVVPRPDGPVVVAGGAWTVPLLARWGMTLPALSYRTQLASLQLDGGGSTPIVHDLAQHFYARPESEGSLLAGDGTQLRPFDVEAYDEVGDPEFILSLAQRVSRRFVAGAEATVRSSWAGLCVGTPDRRPLCGPVGPDGGGVFVVTGDNGFGLMRCLALGQRLADSVGGRTAPDLDPRRFGDLQAFELREGYGA